MDMQQEPMNREEEVVDEGGRGEMQVSTSGLAKMEGARERLRRMLVSRRDMRTDEAGRRHLREEAIVVEPAGGLHGLPRVEITPEGEEEFLAPMVSTWMRGVHFDPTVVKEIKVEQGRRRQLISDIVEEKRIQAIQNIPNSAGMSSDENNGKTSSSDEPVVEVQEGLVKRHADF